MSQGVMCYCRLRISKKIVGITKPSKTRGAPSRVRKHMLQPHLYTELEPIDRYLRIIENVHWESRMHNLSSRVDIYQCCSSYTETYIVMPNEDTHTSLYIIARKRRKHRLIYNPASSTLNPNKILRYNSYTYVFLVGVSDCVRAKSGSGWILTIRSRTWPFSRA
jgi:hypothetical protein